jgi:hypothetical protein
MVRICCVDDCQRPYGVFGCVFFTGKPIYCDDCRQKMPKIYEGCATRLIKPSPKDSTHGICRVCSQKLRSSLQESHNIMGRSPQRSAVNL